MEIRLALLWHYQTQSGSSRSDGGALSERAEDGPVRGLCRSGQRPRSQRRATRPIKRLIVGTECATWRCGRCSVRTRGVSTLNGGRQCTRRSSGVPVDALAAHGLLRAAGAAGGTSQPSSRSSRRTSPAAVRPRAKAAGTERPRTSTCPRCGAKRSVRMQKRIGRSIPYRTLPALPLPEDVVIPTCSKCQSEFVDKQIRNAHNPEPAPHWFQRKPREAARFLLFDSWQHVRVMTKRRQSRQLRERPESRNQESFRGRRGPAQAGLFAWWICAFYPLKDYREQFRTEPNQSGCS
jgi:hypothetical protein